MNPIDGLVIMSSLASLFYLATGETDGLLTFILGTIAYFTISLAFQKI